MIKVQLIILFLFLMVKGYTQDTTRSFGIKSTYHHGAILPHRPEINEIIEGHTNAVELSFYKSTTGENDWQQLYHFPKVGISLLAIDLGNEKELGQSYGIFPFVEFPLSQRKISCHLKVGYGLGYIEKPFHLKHNYKNIAIGTHVNALIFGNLIWSAQLSNRLSSSLGLSLIHFSNGSYSRPNLGINIVSLTAGMAYSFGPPIAPTAILVNERQHQWYKRILLGAGIKEVPPVEGPKYVVSTVSFNLIKTRAQKSSYGFGADVFYNTSLSDLIASDTNRTSSSMDDFRFGVGGIYTLDFGKVSYFIEMGVYIFNKYNKNGAIYNRFGTRFHVNDKLFVHLGLKTHFVVADFIEFGVGYTFNK